MEPDPTIEQHRRPCPAHASVGGRLGAGQGIRVPLREQVGLPEAANPVSDSEVSLAELGRGLGARLSELIAGAAQIERDGGRG